MHASFADKYAAFRNLWCHEERGNAAARIVEDFFAVPLEAPVTDKTVVWGAP